MMMENKLFIYQLGLLAIVATQIFFGFYKIFYSKNGSRNIDFTKLEQRDQVKLYLSYVLLGVLVFIFLFICGLLISLDGAISLEKISSETVQKYYKGRQGGSNYDIMFIADIIAMVITSIFYRKYTTKSPGFRGICIITLTVQILYLPVIGDSELFRIIIIHILPVGIGKYIGGGSMCPAIHELRFTYTGIFIYLGIAVWLGHNLPIRNVFLRGIILFIISFIYLIGLVIIVEEGKKWRKI